MGEAKQRERLSQRIRREQPNCVFCGGATRSETVEHYPPRIVFDGKFRPQGLEFGACKACNEGSRRADLIVATLSRMMPVSETEAQRQEVRRLIRETLRIPGFADEVQPERDQLGVLLRHQEIAHQLPSWNFLKTDGPIIHDAMSIFGAKLGLAMHTATTARIVPAGGAVGSLWYSNLQAYQGLLPREFLEVCGPGKTLRQGSFEVGDQFRVASIVADTGLMSAHFAVFRESFAIMMMVSEDARKLEDEHALAPGFLKRPQEGEGVRSPSPSSAT